MVFMHSTQYNHKAKPLIQFYDRNIITPYKVMHAGYKTFNKHPERSVYCELIWRAIFIAIF